MDWVYNAYSAVIILSSLAAVPIGVMIWHRRHALGSFAAATALVGCTIWMLGYFGELHATTLDQGAFFSNFQFVGIAFVPPAWLMFTLQYAGYDHYLSRRHMTALAAFPLLSLVFIFTNSWHHLLYLSPSLITVGPFHRYAMDYRVGMWVFSGLCYAMIAIATYLTLQLSVKTNRAYRPQALANVFAALIPWATSFHDLFHFAPLSYLDLTPLAFTFTCAILAWNLFRWHLADLVPVARGVIIENLQDGLVVVDAESRVVDLNPKAATLIDARNGNLVGEPLSDCWPQLARAVDALNGSGPACNEVLMADQRSLELWVSPLSDPQGTLMGRVITLHDVSERVAAEEALRASETRYALAASGANDGLWDWDLTTDEIYFSPRWKAMLGRGQTEIGTRPENWFELVHPHDRPTLRAKIETHLEGVTPQLECEYRILHEDGRYRWMLCRGVAVVDDHAVPLRMAGSQTDITDRKAAEEQLKHDALHDALTGLGNRLLVMERIGHALKRLKREPQAQLAVLFLDLDRFKLVNDSLGHLHGDEMLRTVALRLTRAIRANDTVARLGGDEFVVVLEDIHRLDDAIQTAERLQDRLATAFRLAHREFYTSASIGIALASPDYERPEDLLRDADLALYRAKANGGGGYAVFNPGMRDEAVAQLQIETDLRQALGRDAFRLHYQPIFDLPSQEVIGLEALLRWDHPSRGLLLPGDFLHIAEETGLIVPIGYWALNEACRQLSQWHAEFPASRGMTVSVNLSGRQLTTEGLSDEIVFAVANNNLRPGDLQLEITESAVITDGILAKHQLAKLRELGVKVSIDDFGTGYSSLSMLHNFPVDGLKIDKSFIQRLNNEELDAQIIMGILGLAKGLGLSVVAEGVETRSQLERVVELGATLGQGFLLGGADDPVAVQRWLGRRATMPSASCPSSTRARRANSQ